MADQPTLTDTTKAHDFAVVAYHRVYGLVNILSRHPGLWFKNENPDMHRATALEIEQARADIRDAIFALNCADELLAKTQGVTP